MKSYDKLEITVYDFALILWAKKVWFVGIILFFTGVSLFLAKNKPEIYESKVVYYMESRTPQLNLGGMSALLGAGVVSDGFDKFEPVLNSVDLSADFIEKNNLLPQIIPESYDSTGILLPSMNVELIDGVKVFRENYLKYAFSGKLLTITIKHENPQKAFEWLNLFREMFVNKVTALKKAENESALLYLKQKMSKTFVPESRRALASLISDETRKGMMIGRSMLQEIDSPRVSNRNIGSKGSVIVVMGVILGVIFAFLVIFGLEFVQSFQKKKVVKDDEK